MNYSQILLFQKNSCHTVHQAKEVCSACPAIAISWLSNVPLLVEHVWPHNNLWYFAKKVANCFWSFANNKWSQTICKLWKWSFVICSRCVHKVLTKIQTACEASWTINGRELFASFASGGFANSKWSQTVREWMYPWNTQEASQTTNGRELTRASHVELSQCVRELNSHAAYHFAICDVLVGPKLIQFVQDPRVLCACWD